MKQNYVYNILTKVRTKDGVHCYTRCVSGDPYLKDDKVKRAFSDIIIDAQNKFQFSLHGYIIMDNHYHAFLTPQNDLQLPKIMQYINYRLSRYINKYHGRSGCAFQSRYRKKFVAEAKYPEVYANWLLVHIGMNPCRNGIVSDPKDYVFSSYNAYMNKQYKTPIVITFNDYYKKLGFDFRSRRQALIKLESEYSKMLYSY